MLRIFVTTKECLLWQHIKTVLMQLVERHVVLDNIYEEICRKSGLLYNWVTYYYRQVIFGQVQPFGEYELSGLCAEY